VFRTLSLTLALALCAAAAVITLAQNQPAPPAPAVSTLEALQEERAALARSLAPAVVAIALTRPVLTPDALSGMTGPSADAAAGFVWEGRWVVTTIEALPLRRPGEGEFASIGDAVWMMAHDGTAFSGRVAGRDLRNLLLLVRMDDGHPDLPSLTLGDSDRAAIGSTAMGLGNSLNSIVMDRHVHFSFGAVTGFYRFEPVDVLKPDDPASGGDPYKGNALETDVAVHSGDHGGPLVNLRGEVIGMLCAHFMPGRYLGTAVPSNQIRAVLPQLKRGVAEDDLPQGHLGFRVRESGFGGDILITEVEAGGPAHQAGLEPGWVLTRVDNYEIPDWDRLREMLGVGRVFREVTVSGGLFSAPRRVELPVSYGVPVGAHMQLTVRHAQTGREKTVNLIVGQKEEDF
jgi:S1-C subfamily serine protease